jgi:hypothetical protein
MPDFTWVNLPHNRDDSAEDDGGLLHLKHQIQRHSQDTDEHRKGATDKRDMGGTYIF